MSRRLHSFIGLAPLVLIVALALSGAILAFYPVRNALAPTVQAPGTLSVADVVGKVTANLPTIEELRRTPAGSVIASYTDANGDPHRDYVDIRTGASIRPVAVASGFYSALKDFHRAFLLGNAGRIAAGLGAALMAVLTGTGLILMIARMGGVARLFDRPKGTWPARFHTVLSRLALLPFLLSALTGLYIVLAVFSVIPVGNTESAAFPQSTQTAAPLPPGKLPGLASIPFAQFRSLQFPYADDPTATFSVRTTSGLVVVDRGTGAVLERVAMPLSQKIYAWIYAMHTGVGMAWIGVILALAALTVPVLGATGGVIWWRRSRGQTRRIAGNASAASADTIVLVGSEGGATWGFARSLHRDLSAAGHVVHVAPINAFRNHYAKARQVLFMTSTYGSGQAPASANRFAAILADMSEIPGFAYAVLGFGDRAFAHFCQFAKDLDADLKNHGWRRLLPPEFISRQSTQAFTSWGADLGAVLGAKLTLSHRIELPPLRKFSLLERTVYGADVQAPTAVLRFTLEDRRRSPMLRRLTGRGDKRPRFAPSDLLGIVPPGSETPRYYSIASAASDSEVEICVRKQIGGECSGLLHALAIGGEVEAFVKPNPDFGLPLGRRPVIMVGAGTGIAPFIGMICANRARRALHLFWGGREPKSDFLFHQTLMTCLANHQLTSLTTAFSRVSERAYVQDRLREESATLAEMLRLGASVMVCGGDAMARAVKAEFEAILAPLGLSVLKLKSRGHYLEDIF